MNQATRNRQPKGPDCADSISMAERELAAFFRAVTELFGSELAELSAKQWLRELEAAEDLPASTREWRRVTARASAWLANRINVLLPSTECATT